MSGVFDAEHRCLVRLCGETQRLLEQLEPEVSANQCLVDEVRVCVDACNPGSYAWVRSPSITALCMAVCISWYLQWRRSKLMFYYVEISHIPTQE